VTSTTLRETWQEVKLDRNLKQTTTHQRVVFNFHLSKIIIDQLFLKAEIEEKLLTPAPKISRRIVNSIIRRTTTKKVKEENNITSFTLIQLKEQLK